MKYLLDYRSPSKMSIIKKISRNMPFVERFFQKIVEKIAERCRGVCPSKNIEAEVFFMCNICRESPKSPISTLCGHIYCWECIKKWYEMKEKYTFCPVCRQTNGIFDIIPVHPRCTGIKYDNILILKDKSYKYLFDSYVKALNALINDGSERVKYFFTVKQLRNTQSKFSICFIGLSIFYYWLSKYN